MVTEWQFFVTMDSDNELRAGSPRCGSMSRGDVPVPQGDSTVKESSASSPHDAVTRKIRNPLLNPQATPPLAQLPVPAAQSEPPPRIAAGLVPPNDVSGNIHPFPAPSPADQQDKSSAGSTMARHKGLVIVVAIVVAGTAVDIFLWRMSSARHAKTAHLMEAIATSTAFANATEFPRTTSATSTVPIAEPLLDRSPSEVGGETAEVDLAQDGIAARGGKKKLDVANDQQSQVVEASATELVASSKSVGSLERTKPRIGSQTERPSPRPRSEPRSSQAVVKPKPKKDIRGKSTPKGGDDFGMDLRTTSARRPTTTIDEKDPYSP